MTVDLISEAAGQKVKCHQQTNKPFPRGRSDTDGHRRGLGARDRRQQLPRTRMTLNWILKGHEKFGGHQFSCNLQCNHWMSVFLLKISKYYSLILKDFKDKFK